MTEQECRELINELYNTQEKFYIKIIDTANFVSDFKSDCLSDKGFRIKSIEHHSLVIGFHDQSRCSSYTGHWTTGVRRLIEGSYQFIRTNNRNVSNKGRKNCFKCNCKTEERRDFSDMSLREMCPRCKI